MSTQEKIFEKYHLRMQKNKQELQERQDFISALFKKYYEPHIRDFPQPSILEIGCNKGFMLQAIQQSVQGGGICGIDLSPVDIEYAKARVPSVEVYCEDAFEHLKRGNKYDVILSKDVMEHIAKDKQELFVELIYDALNPQGVAMIQLPNMDWFLSNHERYMDFTHEIGYTRESIVDVFRLHFPREEVVVFPVSYDFPHTYKQRFTMCFLKPILIKFIRLLLRILGEGAMNTWFEFREMMVVVHKK